MDINTVKAEMTAAAVEAAADMYKQIGGDRYACGFAWVTIYPKHKGNTRLGKAERAVLTALGFRKDYTGRAYELWNPSGSPVQNVDIKEAGARAAATVLRGYGLDAYCGSRLD
jgi:hypothetical protein